MRKLGVLGKVTLTAVLSTAMIMGNIGGTVPICQNMQQVKAEDIPYVELNEEFDSVDEAYFTLPTCGSVTFEGKEGKTCSIEYLYGENEDGNLVKIYESWWNIYYKGKFRLGAGTYKVVSEGLEKINFTDKSSNSFEQEWNDSLNTANKIDLNHTYKGNLNCWQEDYCSEDEDGNITVISQIEEDSANKILYSKRYRLPAGTYYICVSGDENNFGPIDGCLYADITDYQLKVNYTEESSDKYEQEYNDTIDTANPIVLNSTYTGNIPEENDLETEPTVTDTPNPVETDDLEIEPTVTDTPNPVETDDLEIEPTVTNTPNPAEEDDPEIEPTVTDTPNPTEEPDMIEELIMYSDVDEDEELRVGDNFTVYAEAFPDELNEDLEVI